MDREGGYGVEFLLGRWTIVRSMKASKIASVVVNGGSGGVLVYRRSKGSRPRQHFNS